MLLSLIVVWTLIHRALGAILPLYASDEGTYYTSIEFGNQPLYLLVDTGSPRTWVVTNQTVCYGPSESRISCSMTFGKPYVRSSTYTPYKGLDNQTRLTYGDGSSTIGVFGYEDLTVGNIKIPQARIIIATLQLTTTGALWPASGILGLGPDYALTQGRLDTLSATESNALDPLPYALAKPRFAQYARQTAAPGEEILTRIWNGTGIPAYIGLSMSRTAENHTANGTAGVLTIGERLDLSDPYINATGHGDDDVFAEVSLIKEYSYSQNDYIYAHHTINSTGITIGRGRDAILYPFEPSSPTYYGGGGYADINVIVDSGTSANYIPSLHASFINALFEPRAYRALGLWFVDCNATPPDVAVNIADSDFYINPLDMIIEVQFQNKSSACASAFQETDYSFGIYGQPFLKNVYTETYSESYDGPEAASMWIASREHYAVE